MQRPLKLHTFYSFRRTSTFFSTHKAFLIQPKMHHTRSPSSIGTKTLSSPSKSHCCFSPHFSPVILARLSPKMKTHLANCFPEPNVLPDGFIESSLEALLSASLHESPYNQLGGLGDSSPVFQTSVDALWSAGAPKCEEGITTIGTFTDSFAVKVVDVAGSQDYKEVGLIQDTRTVIKASKSIVRVLCKALKVV